MSRTPAVFFTSDLHLFHAKVAELRGFSSSAAHDLTLAAHWRAAIRPEDRVFVLGDVTGDSRSLGSAMDLLRCLPGEKHLIAGNHDECHPLNRRAYAALGRYLEAFTSVQSAGRFKGFGVDVVLSHFPYFRDRGEPRHVQWRLPDLGAWLLHGHTHGTERVTLTPGMHVGTGPRRYTREIHVGLDAWGLRPVHVGEIADLIKEHS